tara:strand:- start:1820 stop:1987 length:168 start_codon:yes stop_codon:yes gene_type:complete
MAFKMKGYPMKDNGTELTSEQRARLVRINKTLNNTGITEEQYKSLTAERKALSGK